VVWRLEGGLLKDVETDHSRRCRQIGPPVSPFDGCLILFN
jgi:hypothetical protein